MSDATEHAAFEHILECLRQTRGFDFTAYRRTSLMRRVVKRMHAVGVSAFEPYLAYLQIHPDEFAVLFNTILINVTSFFRDEDVWEALRVRALPQLLSSRLPGDPIRVWSAGCASGQEAYSSAMLIAESVGLEAFRERVTIYATDVDEEALAEARRAVYQAKQLAGVPASLVGKYFEPNGDGYVFSPDLRRSVIVERHDLIHDAPIAGVDLLLCRNTLMYFNAEAQARITGRFPVSVKAGGLVVLGRAEMLFNHAMFSPVDLTRRIFRTIPKAGAGFVDVTPLTSLRNELLQSRRELETVHEELRSTNASMETVFTSLKSAVIVLDREMRVQVWNAGASNLWGLGPDETQNTYFFGLDIGLPVAELHEPIRDVLGGSSRERELLIRSVSRTGKSLQCRVGISPLRSADRSISGAIVLMEEQPLAG